MKLEKGKKVALLIETSNSYARGVLRGIIGYKRQDRNWSIFLPELVRGSLPSSWISGWQGDGIIARIENKAIAKALSHIDVPIVDVSAGRHLPKLPWVETDDSEIASLGFSHLLSIGCEKLAFCGDSRFNWSKWRQQKFESLCKEHGIECISFSKSTKEHRSSWKLERTRLLKWVSDLPRPIGVMACYDILAQQLLDVCQELEIFVPEQMSVVGVDNDHLLCELSSPSLTSVETDTYATGMEAASLLDRMMAGEKFVDEVTRVKPLRIVVRQSTDTIATEDPEIAKAIKFIRENAHLGILVNDVVNSLSVSRRVFERRFKKAIGRTPLQEIRRVKIESVRKMLLETDLTVGEIALRHGFDNKEYLIVSFKEVMGITPMRYRQSHGR